MWSKLLLWDYNLSSLVLTCHNAYEDIWEFLFSDFWPLVLSRALQISWRHMNMEYRQSNPTLLQQFRLEC